MRSAHRHAALVGAATRNLRTIAAELSPAAIKGGADWYARANGTALRIAADYSGVSPADVAAVLAILSPANKWKRNQWDARALIAHWHGGGKADDSDAPLVCTYGPNKRKAYAYLDGDRAQLSGPKVESFAANIRGDHEYVTLDRWAVRAALKRDNPGRDAPAIAAAYRKVAAEHGYTPAAFQAVVWVHIRGESE